MLLTATTGCRKGATEPEPVVPELPAVDPQTVLLRDNFDAENNGAGVNDFAQFTQWNVVSGCVDLHGNGFFDVQKNNGLYVDLDGSCHRAGTIESKNDLALAPGNYVLEFWLAGNNRVASSDTVVVSLGSVFSERIVVERGEPFRQFTRPITVTSAVTTRLRFGATGGDDQGPLLDQVRLRRGS